MGATFTIMRPSIAPRLVWRGKGRSTVRTGNAPTNLATLRSAVANALRRVGYAFIPLGRRGHTTPTAALDLNGSVR